MSNRRIAVRKSGIHGRGVFALKRIAKGETIFQYRGELRTHEDVEREYDGIDTGHTFLFTLNPQYVIDGGRGGNSARWINHACQPNCEAYWVESESGDPRRDRIEIESLRDIGPGEELTYDYHIDPEEPLTEELKARWACRCGSKRCRGTMLRPPSRRERVVGAARKLARHYGTLISSVARSLPLARTVASYSPAAGGVQRK